MIKEHSVYLGYCAPHLSLLLKLNSFFSFVLFSNGSHNGREKKEANQQLYGNQAAFQRCNLPFFALNNISKMFKKLSIV